jgi:hypothetical protein
MLRAADKNISTPIILIINGYRGPTLFFHMLKIPSLKTYKLMFNRGNASMEKSDTFIHRSININVVEISV